MANALASKQRLISEVHIIALYILEFLELEVLGCIFFNIKDFLAVQGKKRRVI